MKVISRNWKAVLAVLLAAAAVLVYFLGYRPRLERCQQEMQELGSQIAMLQTTVANNEKYKDVQGELDAASQAIAESRAELYAKFPAEFREEDQLLYLLYLDEALGQGGDELGYSQELHEIFTLRFPDDSELKDIKFEFGDAVPVQVLSDGAVLQGMNLTAYYHASYEDFKNMVNYLATDSRIASIRYATFRYDEAKKLLDGKLELVLYLLDSDTQVYEAPEVTVPSTGKTDIFG